jgi:hypothetical protein
MHHWGVFFFVICKQYISKKKLQGGFDMVLTSKELMLLQDNIKMTQNGIQFMQACSQISSDAQIKNLCNQMIREHQSDLQTLVKHITTAGMN